MKKIIVVCLLWTLSSCKCNKSCEVCPCGDLGPQLFDRKWQFQHFSDIFESNYYNTATEFAPPSNLIRPIWIRFDNCQMSGQLESTEIYGHIDTPYANNYFARIVVDFPTDTNTIPQKWDRQFVNRLKYSDGFQVDSNQGMILKYNIGNIGDILVFTPSP